MKTLSEIQNEVAVKEFHQEYSELECYDRGQIVEEIAKAFAKECLTEAAKEVNALTADRHMHPYEALKRAEAKVLSILEEIK